MEFKSTLTVVFLVTAMCFTLEISASSREREGREEKNGGMVDILRENRKINKEISKGRMDRIVVEGDILIEQSNSSRIRRTVTRREGMKWPGGVVPYIVDTTFRDREKRIIFSAMQRFHDETCIKFRKRTIEPDYLFITPGKGCWSMVGRQGGMQKLSLVGTCKVRKGTIMHELMHCLGFRHEHNRPDRDNFIRIMWYNIENGYSDNFIQHSSADVDTMQTTYDYFSIMHYPLTAFSSNGQWTIQPLRLHHNYGAIGSRHDFSDQDVTRLNKLYKCGACVDTDELYCPVWAMRGECQRNLAWMAEHCPLSCDSCPERTSSGRVFIKDCDDNNEQCPHWAQRGECSRNPSYMESHCRMSCQLCYYDLPEQQENDEDDDECRDLNTLCPEWALLGECTRKRSMQINCKESCQICGRRNNRACKDSESSCPAWAAEGLCRTHSEYMLQSCRRSCNVCTAGETQRRVTSNKLRKKTTITNEILDETIHNEEDDGTDGTVVDYCTDLHSACSQWAGANDCVNNPEWMAMNCPKSCGLCGNSGVGSACVDRHENCALWVNEGDCETFPEWMSDKCPASCLFCSKMEAAQTPNAKLRTVKCRDKKPQCESWAQAGQCEEYEHWMTINCPKSCNTCGTVVDVSCVDREKKCPLWATKRECRKNRGWFLPNCQYSCNACTKVIPSCEDQHRSCLKKAKKGLCSKKAKIQKECPYSCNLCGI